MTSGSSEHRGQRTRSGRRSGQPELARTRSGTIMRLPKSVTTMVRSTPVEDVAVRVETQPPRADWSRGSCSGLKGCPPDAQAGGSSGMMTGSQFPACRREERQPGHDGDHHAGGSLGGPLLMASTATATAFDLDEQPVEVSLGIDDRDVSGRSGSCCRVRARPQGHAPFGQVPGGSAARPAPAASGSSRCRG